MATRTQSRSSSSNRGTSRTSTGNGRSQSRSRTASNERSAFSWGDNAGPLLGAALAGAAIGFAANVGRKLISQGFPTSGDWDETLAAEHDAALSLFDRMLSTDETQSWKRSMLLVKLTHALDKHAHQEEMVVYPVLREANMASDADELEGEHGYVKTYLYELKQMGPEAPNWLEKVREFRALVSKHARMEEEEVFPRLKRDMTKEQIAKITALMNKDGFWMS